MPVEVPELTPEEGRKLAARAWVSGLYATMGFLAERLGPEAISDYSRYSAGLAALQLRQAGVSDSLSFALANATLFKNAYGSEVEVSGSPEEAELKLVRCANLEAALELAERGLPVERERHCAGCLNYMRALAEELGLKLSGQLTEKGCTMKVRRR